jgi:SAM-dependent methyltransferase
MHESNAIELDFSRKYDEAHAQQYLRKHQDGFMRRLSNWREVQLARRALQLADAPRVVLDLPCGAGRFWPMLCEKPDRMILAADNSNDMLVTARAAQSAEVAARVDVFRTSAFAIDLAADAVDCVFCIRLLHHVESAGHRLALLREFKRVSRDTAIVSLWVDGNYKAWKRRRLERRRAAEGRVAQNRNRFIVADAVIEREFSQAGFRVLGRLDFLPGYAMWRTYVLRKAS